MATVKTLTCLLKDAKEINIVWNGLCRKYDPEDALDVDAFGSYVVDQIVCISKHAYELRIACHPVKYEVNKIGG